MSTGAGGLSVPADPRRRGSRTLVLVMALLLLLGGGGAIVVALLTQTPPPPLPVTGAAAASPEAVEPAVPEPLQPVAPPLPSVEPSSPAAPPEALPVALPTRVSIPSIGVDSELITLGLNSDGTLAVPEGPDYDKAAWFDGSPRPGADGPAVIEGHVDSAQNGPSVFYELGALQVGADIQVTREDGTSVTFVVERVEVYPKNAFPTYEVYRSTEGPELRLITCGGDFDSASGSYRDNTVVFARLA